MDRFFIINSAGKGTLARVKVDALVIPVHVYGYLNVSLPGIGDSYESKGLQQRGCGNHHLEYVDLKERMNEKKQRGERR